MFDTLLTCLFSLSPQLYFYLRHLTWPPFLPLTPFDLISLALSLTLSLSLSASLFLSLSHSLYLFHSLSLSVWITLSLCLSWHLDRSYSLFDYLFSLNLALPLSFIPFFVLSSTFPLFLLLTLSFPDSFSVFLSLFLPPNSLSLCQYFTYTERPDDILSEGSKSQKLFETVLQDAMKWALQLTGINQTILNRWSPFWVWALISVHSSVCFR